MCWFSRTPQRPQRSQRARPPSLDSKGSSWSSHGTLRQLEINYKGKLETVENMLSTMRTKIQAWEHGNLKRQLKIST